MDGEEELIIENNTGSEMEKVSDDFMAGIDEATKAHLGVEDVEEESNQEEISDDDIDSDGDGYQESVDEQDDDGGDDTPAVDSSLLERAIRAGLSFDDARAVSDPSALARIVERMESATGSREPEEKAPEDDEVEIPDLDEGEYPSDLLAAFNGLKNMILKQKEVIKSLSTAPSRSLDDAQYAALGSEYAGVFGSGEYSALPEGPQKAARDRMKKYIEFVKSDAKASGKQLSDKDAFDRALEFGFPDVSKKAKGLAAKKVAESRMKRVVNRPRTIDGKFAADQIENMSQDDREAAAIREISAMMEKV